MADAFSRLQINNLTETDLSDNRSEDNTIHSAKSSFENVIEETKKPLNQFKIQLLITTGRFRIHESINIFNNTRHIIEYDTLENLTTILREFIQPNLTVSLHCTLEDLYILQKPLKDNFVYKFLHSSRNHLKIHNLYIKPKSLYQLY